MLFLIDFLKRMWTFFLFFFWFLSTLCVCHFSIKFDPLPPLLHWITMHFFKKRKKQNKWTIRSFEHDVNLNLFSSTNALTAEPTHPGPGGSYFPLPSTCLQVLCPFPLWLILRSVPNSWPLKSFVAKTVTSSGVIKDFMANLNIMASFYKCARFLINLSFFNFPFCTLCPRGPADVCSHRGRRANKTQSCGCSKTMTKKPHWMGIYQPTSYKYAVSCFSPRVCVMEALWRSIPVSRWCVLCHKAEHSQGQWILLSTVLNVAWQQSEAAWMGKHHLHRFIHFDLNRWCHADQDRRECKRCVCVRVRVRLHMWGVNAFHYPLLQTCITHIFYFIWRRVMFHMLLLWRVYMYICAVNKYFLFK